MAEYIDREELIAHIKDLPTWWADAGGVYGRSMKYPEGMFDCEDVISSVENAPPADVAPVQHAKWEIVVGSNGKEYMVCTGCRKQQDLTGVFSYCPNCGAKMDETVEDDKR